MQYSVIIVVICESHLQHLTFVLLVL